MLDTRLHNIELGYLNRCPCIMDSQSQLTASCRLSGYLFLNLAFICMDVLSLRNLLIGDPSLSAYTWTQKVSTPSRLQLEGGQGPATVEGVYARRALFLLVLRGSILHWDTQWNRQDPVVTFWPTLLMPAQSFCLSKLQSKSKPGMDSNVLRLLSSCHC